MIRRSMFFQYERLQKVLAGRERAVGKDFAVPERARKVSACERVKRKIATAPNGRVLDKTKPPRILAMSTIVPAAKTCVLVSLVGCAYPSRTAIVRQTRDP